MSATATVVSMTTELETVELIHGYAVRQRRRLDRSVGHLLAATASPVGLCDDQRDLMA